ncbi:MAG: hypothetical protein ABSF29_03115 [Tepidisphaeraceae bacterium]
MENVLLGAFFGVGQIDEEFPARQGRLGDERAQLFPNLRHVGDHSPVGHGDEPGGGDGFFHLLHAHALDETIPGDFGKALVFAEHEFSILEFQCVSMAGLGDGDDFGFSREIGEDWVGVGESEVADVGDVDPRGRQRVGHDGAVAAEFDLFDQ